MPQTDWPYLNSAPIKEAIINIHYVLNQPFSKSAVAAFETQLKDSYPVATDVTKQSVTFEMGKEAGDSQSVDTSSNSEFAGIRLTDSEGRYVVQILQDQLVFSHLAPYQGWEELIKEARRIWGIIVEILCPTKVIRVATRYINEIEMPLPLEKFEDYLMAPPLVPEKLPKGIAKFYSRAVLPEPKCDAVIVFSQAIEPRPGLDALPAIIDTDVFKTVDLDSDSEIIWDLLAVFREIKNNAFYSAVTKRTLDIYK